MIDNIKSSIPLPKYAEPSSRLHLDYLDGIRALAALWVVIAHTWIGPFGSVVRTGLKGWFTNWILYGHLAVDIFIVLSGFCLALPVAQSGLVKGGAIGFYKKRAHRILPPLYFAMALSLLLNLVTSKVGHHSVIGYQGIFANIFLLQDFIPVYNILGPFWSVALEWKIYFLFPFLIWIWRRFNMAWSIFVAAFIAYGLTLIMHIWQPVTAMSNTCPWYVLLFALGMYAGVKTVGLNQATALSKLYWIMAATLIPLICILAEYPITPQGGYDLYFSHLPIIDPLTGAFTATFLLFLYQRLGDKRHTRLLQVLSWRPIVFLGKFSYSLYLIHLPLLWLITGGLHRIPSLNSSTQITAIIEFLVVIPVIVGLAYIFFLFCERPFMNHKPDMSAGRRMEEENNVVQEILL